MSLNTQTLISHKERWGFVFSVSNLYFIGSKDYGTKSNMTVKARIAISLDYGLVFI